MMLLKKELKRAKYLGVIIDHHLSWNEHINQIIATSKANNINKIISAIEAVQRHGARYATNNYSRYASASDTYECLHIYNGLH